MSNEVKFNLTVGHTPLPNKTALVVNPQLNLFSDSQPSMACGKRPIACEENHPTCFRHDISHQRLTTRAFLSIRRARRGRNYVAVQIVPAGVAPLRILNRTRAEKCGMEIVYAGEGYREHNGPHSAFGKAIATAKAYIASSGLTVAGEF